MVLWAWYAHVDLLPVAHRDETSRGTQLAQPWVPQRIRNGVIRMLGTIDPEPSPPAFGLTSLNPEGKESSVN